MHRSGGFEDHPRHHPGGGGGSRQEPGGHPGGIDDHHPAPKDEDIPPHVIK